MSNARAVTCSDCTPSRLLRDHATCFDDAPLSSGSRNGLAIEIRVSYAATGCEMKYSVESAIADFDAMVQEVSPRVAQKPEYAAVKSGFLEYLSFLEPLVSGRYLYSAEEIDWFWPKFLREELNIRDEQISERALYFGVMAFSVLVVLKRRENYRKIDFTELAELWQPQCLYPVESLKNYGFFDHVNMNGLDTLLQGFLRLHVKPLITSPDKNNEVFSHFETQFFSGILLGQLVAYLILRDHYEQRSG
jgi:hypothetical protein